MDDQVSAQQRRHLLLVILGGIMAALGAVSLWPVWRFLSPPADGGERATVTLARSEIEPGKAHFFNFRGRPAVVLQPTPGNFAAFSAVCTHLGCIVKWESDKGEFLCPCHGGRFSAQGKVVAGPPPSPLESIPVAASGDQIIVG